MFIRMEESDKNNSKRLTKDMRKIDLTDFDHWIIIKRDCSIEGGEFNLFSLEEKCYFYQTAFEMTALIIDIFHCFDEQIVIAGPFGEQNNYHEWKDLHKFYVTKELKQSFKPNSFITLDINHKKQLIETIVEANMKYLSRISFFAPKNQFLIRGTPHEGFLVYSRDEDTFIETISPIISAYHNWMIELKK